MATTTDRRFRRLVQKILWFLYEFFLTTFPQASKLRGKQRSGRVVKRFNTREIAPLDAWVRIPSRPTSLLDDTCMKFCCLLTSTKLGSSSLCRYTPNRAHTQFIIHPLVSVKHFRSRTARTPPLGPSEGGCLCVATNRAPVLEPLGTFRAYGPG
jgi:hypothetical protein